MGILVSVIHILRALNYYTCSEISIGLNVYIKLRFGIQRFFNRLRVSSKNKIFCVGFNKTGTTSLLKEMTNLGFIAGGQQQAELLLNDWVKRDFRRIVKYCLSAEFFQDIPFSLPYTFIAMDQAFPGSKFILTLRENAEQWYESIIRFHGKKWANGKIPPNSEDLKNAEYLYKGFAYQYCMYVYGVQDNDPYNKDILIKHYRVHKKNVLDYFKYRSDDLLVINIKEDADYAKFCEFLGIEQERPSFPWENKT